MTFQGKNLKCPNDFIFFTFFGKIFEEGGGNLFKILILHARTWHGQSVTISTDPETMDQIGLQLPPITESAQFAVHPLVRLKHMKEVGQTRLFQTCHGSELKKL